MAASYPSSQKTFTKKVDLTSVVQAADVNDTYDEIQAIEATVGITPDTVSTYSGTPDFSTPNTWGTVANRISNIEKAAYYSYQNGLTILGGGTVSTPNTTTSNLTVSAISSQTSSLLKIVNGATTLLSVSPAGALQAVTIDGGSA